MSISCFLRRYRSSRMPKDVPAAKRRREVPIEDVCGGISTYHLL
jgi:hypothetical protein